MENFRSPTPTASLVAAVTGKASTAHGGWSPAPIGQNIKAETYPRRLGAPWGGSGERAPRPPAPFSRRLPGPAAQA